MRSVLILISTLALLFGSGDSSSERKQNNSMGLPDVTLAANSGVSSQNSSSSCADLDGQQAMSCYCGQMGLAFDSDAGCIMSTSSGATETPRPTATPVQPIDDPEID